MKPGLQAGLPLLLLLLLPSVLPVSAANDPADADNPFYYDWHNLRVGGLICAAILCAIGIIVLMSGRCKCRFSQKHNPRGGNVPTPLMGPGSSSNC
ncbi:FXYD domain-containing ion transport regulator 3-like [Ornithorhynchus anatinus]|uniref:FXYD domain-containing ion transport regulator 3-like n=1 Tax=Ornithorhynchus anatinus TaxID=9258 RepID=UPI0010A81832|nr:FXYD domain-containing ion transport regulator 3-like [Ornithorhynchus anatinus]